jgi:formimidoylglutamate deiminase
MKIDRVWHDGNWHRGFNLVGVPDSEAGSAPADSIAIPGLVNAHSHAFQRAFAGLTEFRSSTSDDFWTWRSQMYRFLQQLTPEACYAIARQLYTELVENGFTCVVEFHYLHNQVGGTLYDEPSEMADVLIAAAKDVGIRITMLPVLYQRAGFDDQPLDPSQKRFCLTSDQFCELVSTLAARHRSDPLVNIGIAYHSLRAVSLDTITETLDSLKSISDVGPIHMHVAEQIPEVEACLETQGKRPIELCLDNLPLDSRWCLIHCTHMTDDETVRLAKSGAIAGLCPTTEANLGDGIFPAMNFLKYGGAYAIGTDSHVSSSPWNELRLLEYGQRLIHHQRAILDLSQSNGSTLYRAALCGGNQAAYVDQNASTGDWIILDQHHPSISAKTDDRIIDSLIFCEHGCPIDRVYVNGQQIVESGLHRQHDDTRRQFNKTMAFLMQRI